jgi:hypothetical protein
MGCGVCRLMIIVELICRERENINLHKISHRAHSVNYGEAIGEHCISEEALEYFRYKDDFITTDPEATHRRFEWLLYPPVDKFEVSINSPSLHPKKHVRHYGI